MFRHIADRSITKAIRHVPDPHRPLYRGVPSFQKPLPPTQNTTRTACQWADCWCEKQRKETASKAAKLKTLGAEEAFSKYDPLDKHSVRRLEAWYAAGPPPLSEYRLTFGKHEGKRLDQVPDTYLVKYLIPRWRGGGVWHEGNFKDPVVTEAVGDFVRKFPDGKVKVKKGR